MATVPFGTARTTSQNHFVRHLGKRQIVSCFGVPTIQLLRLLVVLVYFGGDAIWLWLVGVLCIAFC